MYFISGYDGGCPSLGTVSVVGTPLVEGADRRVHAVPVPRGDDRSHAGGSTDLVLPSHGPYARGPVLCGGTRMDHQRDSVWIESLEATALSADEEKDTQTPVSLEGDMRLTEKVEILISARRRNAGAPSWGVEGGVVGLPPPQLLRPHGLTIVCPQNLQEFRFSNPRNSSRSRLDLPCPQIRSFANNQANLIERTLS